MTTIICDICPRGCRLEEGQTGFCNVRKNLNGENIDSLRGSFHPFREENNQERAPGSYTLCFVGCPLKCWFCIYPFLSTEFNGDVSSWPGGAYRKLAPHEFVEKVKANAGAYRAGFKSGLGGFFGGEPLIHPEFIVEAGRLLRGAGSGSKVHTSGYISQRIMREVAGSVNVISVNVKASCSPSVYQRMDADPDIVLQSIETAWNTPRVDGRVRDIDTTLIRNLIGPVEHGILPTREETEKFGKWLVEKTDPFIPITLEPATEQIRNHFQGEPVWLLGREDPMRPADRLRVMKRMYDVGEVLWMCGLNEVWVEFCEGARYHIPTGRPWSDPLRPV